MSICSIKGETEEKVKTVQRGGFEKKTENSCELEELEK